MWQAQLLSKGMKEGEWVYTIKFFRPTTSTDTDGNTVIGEDSIIKRRVGGTNDDIKRMAKAFLDKLNAPSAEEVTLKEGDVIDPTTIVEPTPKAPTKAELRRQELQQKVAIVRRLQQDVRDGFVTNGVQAKITELLTEINGLTEPQKRELHGYNELLGI
jgi:hypothetical protein